MIDTNELREYARGFEDLREADLLNGAADEIDLLRSQLASRGGVPDGWPTDDMVIRGAEALHDALRAAGFDLNFDHDLRGTERLQSFAEAVFGAMLAAAPSPEGQAEQAEYMDEIMCDVPGLAAAIWEELEREEFEAWFSDEWQHPKAVERDAVGYKLAAAQNAWTAWQAGWCAALAAQQKEPTT